MAKLNIERRLTKPVTIVGCEFDPNRPTGEGDVYVDQFGRRWVKCDPLEPIATGETTGRKIGNTIFER
jgi:hypothetical protein